MSINPNKPGIYNSAQLGRNVRIAQRVRELNWNRDAGKNIHELRLYDAVTAEVWRNSHPNFPMYYNAKFSDGYCHIGCVQTDNYFQRVLATEEVTLKLVCEPPERAWCVACGKEF